MMISNLWLFVPLFCLCCGLLAFVGKRKHLLNVLLSLEFIMVNIFWFMVQAFSHLGGDLYFILFFLTLAACEGALALALLVSVVRSHGSDNFGSLNVLSC
uniref:NADH-ubiquinone oxidoreductase chain 4L n=1 Tax=Macrobrachium bullatum TaxID=230390 RepID=A0A0U2DW74_9EUCA|nr:NADH dehydrogenase subunit 4L [Macrobrachium bullatum]AKQ09505.1 NADH dehydrogenase subunit 4L [Macrobrachium bullatum]